MKPNRWKSPITADLLTESGTKMDQTVVDKMTKIHYLLEGRPLEGGRVACIQHNDSNNTSKEIFTEFNITSSVHEYGGGALAVHGGLAIFFDKFTGNVFSKTLETSTAPSILYDSSASTKKNNFADFCIHPSLKIAVCIREVHYGDNAAQVVNSVALIVCETGEIIDLVKGDDFYSTPRFSPCGSRLSWISWNHPSMQWRDSSLFAAAFQNNCISSKIKVNNRSKESISRTVWGIDTIYYATDATGFYNISSYSFKTNQVEAVTSLEADFSSPDWLFGWSTFDLLDDGRLVASYSLKGQAVLAIVDPVLKKIDPISQGVYTTVDCVRTLGNGVYFVAKSATSPLALYKMDIATKQVITLHKSAKVAIDPAFISIHQHLEYPCKDGSTGHMIYYPPLNPNYTLSSPPPLLVHLHGGPTAHAKAGLSLAIQYWTSRGFAYADVNYGGSSGYGREHLERLDSKWGIVDVDDTCSAALHLVKLGLADRNKLCVDGGSAGGYTVLAALAFRPDIFKAGTSSYGICSLESLAKLTHKFEAHYLTSLLGGSFEEIPQTYYDRSPLHFASNIKAALLVQQGSIDRVVPPNQAELIVDAIRKQKGIVEYQLFEGEGHGFRASQNIKAQFEKELEFYQKVLDL